MTAFYYDWQKIGEYFFVRFRWVEREISGFAFLRKASKDILQGAWWSNFELKEPPTKPPEAAGVPTVWRRLLGVKTPEWANRFIDDVRSGKIPELR